MNHLFFRVNRAVAVFSLAVILTAAFWAAGCGEGQPAGPEQIGEVFTPAPEAVLSEFALQFDRRVERVTDDIYVAVGYALGNSILIRTSEGNIVVDTTESLEAAEEIKAEFDSLAPGPVVAVIYTHGHPDHVLGTAAFIDSQEEPVDIYAHASTMDFLEEQFGQLQPILNVRGMRQFGSYLPEGYLPCIALGPELRFDHDHVPPFVFPTKDFDDTLELQIGDKRLVLMHMPGETDDQLAVWLPDEKILLSGDNYYPAFPNLYAIRGTSPRPVNEWIKSLDRMRDLGVEILVPSHSAPILGAERIDELLTAYRDAIQYVHDAVIRGANLGKTPDELAEEIKLPPHLQAYPELRELYGTVAWSVRAIYYGYLGWFDGNATGLFPLPTRERALKVAELAGGVEQLLQAAEVALVGGETQWAAELADMLLAIDPQNPDALEIKIEALFKLGEATANTNARGYYFTQAMELSNRLKPVGAMSVDAALARQIPLDKLFESMAVRLDPEASADVVMTAAFRMTDTGETYTVAIRRGIAEIRPGFPDEPDLVLIVEEAHWKELALGVDSPLAALATGRLKVEGFKILKAREFFAFFGE